MRSIIQNPGANLREVEAALTKYIQFPDDVQQVRSALRSKRDAMVEAASDKLAKLQQSVDVDAVKDALEEFTDSTDLLKSGVQMVQKHYDSMCRSVAKRMRAAAAKDDLPQMMELLECSAAYTGSDEVEREQIALRQRYQNVSEVVMSEIHELCLSRWAAACSCNPLMENPYRGCRLTRVSVLGCSVTSPG